MTLCRLIPVVFAAALAASCEHSGSQNGSRASRDDIYHWAADHLAKTANCAYEVTAIPLPPGQWRVRVRQTGMRDDEISLAGCTRLYFMIRTGKGLGWIPRDEKNGGEGILLTLSAASGKLYQEKTWAYSPTPGPSQSETLKYSADHPEILPVIYERTDTGYPSVPEAGIKIWLERIGQS